MQLFSEINLNLKAGKQIDAIRLYVLTQYIRAVELKISEEYKQQIFRCPVHLAIGQEAISSGVISVLTLTDKVISSHRSHAQYLAKGGNIYKFFAELMGLEDGCCKGRGGSMHLFDHDVNFVASIPIVGSSISIAMGIALADKLSNKKDITVAFIGDAALETGAFYESLNIAALKKLPVLIVIEDNGMSTYTEKKERWASNRNLKEIVQGSGLIYRFSDSFDLIEINKIAREVISKVRNGIPAVLHFETNRLMEHCGPKREDEVKYRSSIKLKKAEKQEPLSYYARFLKSSGLISEIEINTLNMEINNFVNRIFNSALNKRIHDFVEFKS